MRDKPNTFKIIDGKQVIAVNLTNEERMRAMKALFHSGHLRCKAWMTFDNRYLA